MQTLSIFAGIVASNVRTEIHKVIEVLTIAFITIGMGGIILPKGETAGTK
ncbi:hypothetical protein Pse7429DRAFT_3756 [Pseudanabaena biceps PCC 7429]|uniref:Uncharacterized protein n=1 Tax=Pseudanabaena biceps PCC 7429 TaxID=927668 RepID=L8MW19_9CYAN|nr:hypothetical protein Pse7429DRAFT_3756 [Pseudanabaena biceps PCC 7429]